MTTWNHKGDPMTNTCGGYFNVGVPCTRPHGHRGVHLPNRKADKR